MLPIEWHPNARADLSAIIRYIADRNPSAARELKQQIESAIQPASAHPFIFRAGRVSGTREVIAHPNYLLVYRVTQSRVEVLAVLHSRQQYPP